ncbi:type I phosphomannose isomerase catalytic subunit [Aquimarina gracilis]|uniref:Phosphohexomutase n=1 Tax=Aquimarina gracilis TaxID=874422 RepID=A0ABU6A0S0_9FLAO|nr:type I phosphomannose isomerase catalytic subunit [Aquimarina gracilis]MEB3347758.1 type I phosphomannose isomerase catalytic subunit [Aquimarina gracilis]
MLYPLKFDPILKEKIWGGNKLKTILGKPVSSTKIGESWEISTIQGNVSVVSNGSLKGIGLGELIKKYKGDLIGEKVYKAFGNTFPLLIKFIDAHEDLSIQLHPRDELAQKRHNSYGKTEMWYVVQADNEAKIIVDFNRETTKEEYQSYLKEGKLIDLLNFERISKGDSFLITSGTIHAIGKGSLIAEIQQTSDITYRVYDWNRKDEKGNSRELHTDLAIDALDFSTGKKLKLSYGKKSNQINEIISIPYFTTNFIDVDTVFKRDCKQDDSFRILMCVEGKGTINTKEYSLPISAGETILIPAKIESLSFESAEKDMKLLEVYIK